MNCGRRNTDLPLCLHCQCSVYYAVYLISLTFQVLLPVLIKLTMSEVISSEAYLDTCISIVHQRSSSSHSFIIQIPRTSHPALSSAAQRLVSIGIALHPERGGLLWKFWSPTASLMQIVLCSLSPFFSEQGLLALP